MAATVTCFPVGNGDTTRIDLASGKKMLVDYADYHNPDDPYEARIDLAKALKEDLESCDRDSFDIVAFTHLDDDHIHNFSKFFWLQFAAKYQDDDRIKIDELWVPAAAITEEGVTGEARILRNEARHRLKKGKGIRVFSRPERLRAWLADQGIKLEDRLHLITDAGKFVPGISKNGPDKVDMFIHSPFAWRLDEDHVEDRNTDSLCFQATFLEGEQHTRMLFLADTTHEMLHEMVEVTRYHNRDEQLEWDIYKSPHHSSYLSISPNKGRDKTKPVPNVKWLLEQQRHDGCIVISSCKPIPVEGSDEDDDPQPPHRQAHNYYAEVAEDGDGEIKVTMEHPNRAKPKPIVIEITSTGAKLVKKVLSGAAAAVATPARAGRR